MSVHNAGIRINHHEPLFTGDILYVDDARADDTGSGFSPESAKATIQAAIDAGAAGDAVTIKAGTYVENVDLDKDAMELWFEIGVIIEPVTGVPLIVSGDNCRLTGGVQIFPPAGEIGLQITGNFSRIGDIGGPTILTGEIGTQITGMGTVIRKCACGLQTSIGYDIQGAQTRLYNCHTVGSGETIGYYISNGADIGILENCSSMGHQTSGFHIYTGSFNWSILDCSSGAGDGRWIDEDHGSVWSEFTFNDEMTFTQTVNGDNNTFHTNLWKFCGTIVVSDLYAKVETAALGADVNNCYWNAWDGTNNVPITLATNPDMDAAAVGALLIKIADADTAADLLLPDQVRIYEDDTKFGVDREFILNAKAGVDNFIRFTYDTANNLTTETGQLHHHIHWAPLSDDGFIENV